MNSVFIYILLAMAGMAISPFMVALIKRYSLEEKVFSQDYFKDIKFDWKIAIITAVTIVVLYYFIGFSVQFFVYMMLGLLLIMDAAIDIKAQIIPNSLNFIGFIIGIVYTYVLSINNIYVAIDKLLGMALRSRYIFAYSRTCITCV